MGFQKGSISLSQGHDVPLLLQVLHSQFITHDQLFEFMRIGCYEFQKPSFNWRVRRLVANALLERQCAQPLTPEPIYSITHIGKLILADHCPVMDGRQHKDAASHVNLIHSLQLNRLHLSLALQGVLADWQSEMAIRAKNEFTPAGYVKNYDAIVTVRIDGGRFSFALEYERSPKKPRTYLRIRSLLEQETHVRRFLYLVPEPRLASLLLDCFAGTAAAIYVGLAPEMIRSFVEMKVIEAASGRTKPITALL